MNNNYNKELWDKARKENRFKVIKISSLPDDCPVLVVEEQRNKSFAEFHLATMVLVPVDFEVPKKIKKTSLK